jgi:ATP synthase assembly factor FMC1
MASTTLQPRIRSLYRQFLRELPSQPSSSAKSNSILSTQSTLHARIRQNFTNNSHLEERQVIRRIEEGEQFAAYLRAQRKYTTLLERYNPGMSMDDQERIRLTARRVGMELPIEYEDR